MRKQILFTIITTTIMLFSGCNLVQICLETKSSIRKSYKYENQIGLTVNDLKTIMINDTTNYKILIFYSPCCAPCVRHLQTTYKKFYEKKDKDVKFYFVNESCGGLKYNEQFMQELGYSEQLYFIRDTSMFFKTGNLLRYNNMLNYIFDLKGDERIDGVFGIPISCVVNKQNRLKIVKCKFEKDSTLRNEPFPLYELTTTDIKSLNYYKIDSSNVIDYDYCYPDGCK